MINAASPKAGKSFFAMELARSVATGDMPFGTDFFSVPETGKVLLLDYEVTEEGLQERALKVLAQQDNDLLDQNFMYVSKDTEKFNLPEMQFSEQQGFDSLRRLLDLAQPNVLIVDPIRRALGSWDESKASDVGLLFGRLDKLLREFRHNKMSIVINHHYRKMPAANARGDWDPLEADNTSGSGRFFGDVDALVTMYREPGNKLNKTGHQFWTVKTRWQTRHSEDPADMFFNINEYDDLRVRFSGKVGQGPAKIDLKPKSRPVKPLKGEQQLMFEQAH